MNRDTYVKGLKGLKELLLEMMEFELGKQVNAYVFRPNPDTLLDIRLIHTFSFSSLSRKGSQSHVNLRTVPVVHDGDVM